MSGTPNMRMVDVWSEPRPLRRKELLEKQRSHNKESGNHYKRRQECGPLFKTSDMRSPTIIVTQPEFRLERRKELLKGMERSSSASEILPKKKRLTPENRQRTWERPTTPPASPPNLGLPVRKKELLERQRSRQRDASAAKLAYYHILSSPVRSQVRGEQLKTPDKRHPAITLLSDSRLERSKELPKRLKSSPCRSASSSKIPTSSEFLTPEDKQGPSKEPNTPEMNYPSCYEPGWEARPLRTKELLERQRQPTTTSRSAPASKIEPKRTKAAVPTSSYTASGLLVPSIGFSYPKDPKACLSSKTTTSKKLPSKLTNTKRNLFHQKEALQQKLERITEEWQRMAEPQLRQLIVDFVNLCLPSAGAECSHLSRDSYVNQLMEALQQLQYPNEVNKTWLRMPKSQTAMSHVLEILDFLMDFAYDQEKDSLCVFPIVPDGKQIFEEAARAFRSGEGLTEQKLKESSTSSEITSLAQEFENLMLQPRDLCMELQSLQQEKQQLQEEIAKCQAEISLSISESADKLKVLGNLYMKKLAQGQFLENLKERVRNQSCSIQDYVKMLDQREELSGELQLLRLRLQEFAERLRLCQLKLKRCQKEQKESIEAFNVRIRDYEYSLTSESSYPTSLQLSSNATIAEVEEVMERLKERRVLPKSSPVKHISSTCRLPLGENNHTPH